MANSSFSLPAWARRESVRFISWSTLEEEQQWFSQQQDILVTLENPTYPQIVLCISSPYPSYLKGILCRLNALLREQNSPFLPHRNHSWRISMNDVWMFKSSSPPRLQTKAELVIGLKIVGKQNKRKHWHWGNGLPWNLCETISKAIYFLSPSSSSIKWGRLD